MNKRYIFIYLFAFLLAVWLFSIYFKMTGFAVNDQKILVSLDILPDQQKIKPGQNLLLEIALRVPGGNIDQTSNVELEYSIRDLDGNIISSKKESGAVAVKESTVASLLVPTVTKPGVYAAFVKVNYQEEIYEASKTFEVVGISYKVKNSLNIIVYILIALIILTLTIIAVKKIRNKYYY